jgi:hypothetical protein
MNITKEMIGAAHDIMLQRGDFVLSANLLTKIYEAMRNKEPMENRESVEQDAMRYRALRKNKRLREFCVYEKHADKRFEFIPYHKLDEELDKELAK